MLFDNFKILLVLVVSLPLVAACSPSLPSTSERYFFPPPPVQPRLEYLKAYASSYDLKPKEKDFFTEYILGEELPQLIFGTPADVAIGTRGRYYVADIVHRQVFVLDTQQNEVRRLRGPFADLDGTERFGVPIGLATDDLGRVYVSDSHARTVHVYAENEKYLFGVTSEQLKRPIGVAVDRGRNRLYVVDTPAHRVVVFDLEGNLLNIVGELGPESHQFNYPTDIDVDTDGNFYVLDSMNAKVKVFDGDGNYLREFGERGTAEGSFTIAKNIAVSPMGHIYVTDSLSHKLVLFDLNGQFLLRLGGKSRVTQGVNPGGFYMPRGVDVGEDGTVLVVDSFNRLIHRLQFLTEEYLQSHPIE